jgi:hypothetical protein
MRISSPFPLPPPSTPPIFLREVIEQRGSSSRQKSEKHFEDTGKGAVSRLPLLSLRHFIRARAFIRDWGDGGGAGWLEIRDRATGAELLIPDVIGIA